MQHSCQYRALEPAIVGPDQGGNGLWSMVKEIQQTQGSQSGRLNCRAYMPSRHTIDNRLKQSVREQTFNSQQSCAHECKVRYLAHECKVRPKAKKVHTLNTPYQPNAAHPHLVRHQVHTAQGNTAKQRMARAWKREEIYKGDQTCSARLHTWLGRFKNLPSDNNDAFQVNVGCVGEKQDTFLEVL